MKNDCDPHKPRLDPPMSAICSRTMIRIRLFEDKCAELYTQEKIRGFLHLYDGEEAIAAGIIPLAGRARTGWSRPTANMAMRWRAACRWALCWPRCTARPRLRWRARRVDASVQTRTTISMAAMRLWAAVCRWPSGWRWPIRMQGSRAVTACFFGEGAVAEGEFHESLNLAALWDLPVLFVCENNGYAMGTRAGPDRGGNRHRGQGAQLCDHI